MRKALWSAGSAAFAAMMAGAALAAGPPGSATNYPTSNQNQPMGSQPQGTYPNSAQPMGTQPQGTVPGTAQPMTSRMTQGTAPQPLSQVSDVSALNSASVQDTSGNPVGTVQKVITGSSGKPTAVQVDAGSFLGTGTKIVSIKASHLRYDRNRNVLTTTLTKSQIKALPAASRM